MSDYKYAGPKTDEFRTCAKVAFLQKNLAMYEDDKSEVIEAYSQTVFKLYQWITLALELRCEDVVSRRDKIEEMRHERENCIAQAAERQEKLDGALQEAEEAFNEKAEADAVKNAEDNEAEDDAEAAAEEEKPVFPVDEFMVDFNTNNPPIEIPAEVVEDIDNDYDLPYTAPTFE